MLINLSYSFLFYWRLGRWQQLALIIVVVLWIALMVADRFLPEYTGFIHILMLGAEAGVVGGLADWYAITVPIGYHQCNPQNNDDDQR
jgi:hypothetical protein